jgi:hypothetical protein
VLTRLVDLIVVVVAWVVCQRITGRGPGLGALLVVVNAGEREGGVSRSGCERNEKTARLRGGRLQRIAQGVLREVTRP